MDAAETIALDLPHELRQLQAERWKWTTRARDKIVQDYEKYNESYNDWYQRMRAVIANLWAKGQADLADKLAGGLLDSSKLNDPGNFALTVPLAEHNEYWQIVGTTTTSQDVSSQRPSVPVPIWSWLGGPRASCRWPNRWRWT